MKSNTCHIVIDRNPDMPSVNVDLLFDVAGFAFDWRLLGYDNENGYDEICAAIYEKLNSKRHDIATACNIPVDEVIIRTESLDESEFMWAIEFEWAYKGTTSTYQSAALISYVVDDSTFTH